MLTAKEIVDELNRFIISQVDAKRCVAVSLRNRWRRLQVKDDGMREEIVPKNIIMAGPTGVGKTEIARRLAKLDKAPFVKVEASKFTEVGYVGRDVESMIRDLVEMSIKLVREEETEKVTKKAEVIAKEKIVNDLLAGVASPAPDLRNKFREKFERGELNNEDIVIEVPELQMPGAQIATAGGMEQVDFSGMMGMFPQKMRKVTMPVKEAYKMYVDMEVEKMLDLRKIITEALERAQQKGIIFIDEIDKIIGCEGASGPDVSRQGVQRDLLPIVEGSTVPTKYGMVKTDHILFIAAGAFHKVSPANLIPELQGRFPIVTKLNSLTCEDFVRILTEPEYALPKQYAALLGVEGVNVEFTREGIIALAEYAWNANKNHQDIGARRLFAVLEHVLEQALYEAPEGATKVVVDEKTVKEKAPGLFENTLKSDKGIGF